MVDYNRFIQKMNEEVYPEEHEKKQNKQKDEVEETDGS